MKLWGISRIQKNPNKMEALGLLCFLLLLFDIRLYIKSVYEEEEEWGGKATPANCQASLMQIT